MWSSPIFCLSSPFFCLSSPMGDIAKVVAAAVHAKLSMLELNRLKWYYWPLTSMIIRAGKSKRVSSESQQCFPKKTIIFKILINFEQTFQQRSQTHFQMIARTRAIHLKLCKRLIKAFETDFQKSLFPALMIIQGWLGDVGSWAFSAHSLSEVVAIILIILIILIIILIIFMTMIMHTFSWKKFRHPSPSFLLWCVLEQP